MHRKLAAVVVTYNRKQLLQRCINALLAQTAPLDRIFIIDNASTDGTEALLASPFYRNEPRIECVRLPENIGGAGGFADGMRRAYDWGADHTWIMDDDAIPAADALETLLPHAGASVVPSSTLVGEPRGRLYGACTGKIPRPKEIALKSGFGVVECSAVSFVGPLLSRDCIRKNGFPRSDFFIWFDDLEYCIRATSNGFKIIIVEASKIYHQMGQSAVPKRFLWISRSRPRIPNWKYYYGVRNNIAFLKEYSDSRLFSAAYFSALMARNIVGDFMFEPGQAAYRSAYRLRGAWDGLMGRMGKRVLPH